MGVDNTWLNVRNRGDKSKVLCDRQEMTRRSKGRKRGAGRGNFQGRRKLGIMSFNQQRGIIEESLEFGQSSPHKGPSPEMDQSSSREGPIESQSSRILSVHPSLKAENRGADSAPGPSQSRRD